MISTGGRIKFDLTKFDINKARSNAGQGLYDEGVGYTDWEFNQVLGNENLLNATDFYRDGKFVPTSQVLKEAGITK